MIPTPTDSTRVKNNERLTAKELREFLNHNGISNKEFSEILGVTTQAVSMWIVGTRDFSITNSRIIRMFVKYPQLIREF